MYVSDAWLTFHDFLRSYLGGVFGKEWMLAEEAKPFEDRHPVAQWAARSLEDHRRLGTKAGRVTVAPATGAIMAFGGLAYNLYLVAHNVAVQAVLIRRLKDRRAFWGAL